MLVMMAIQDMLSDLGCTAITVAGSIETALELIATKPFDLATLDVNLNGRKSSPIAKALTEAGVPFALSTGYGEHGVGEDYGDHLVLNKPYSPNQLAVVLTTLLSPTAPPALAA